MSAKPTSWPAPVAFEDATCVRDLCDRIRNPDGSIYAIRLWQHRRRQGATFAGDNAAGTLESVCRWRRKRGALVEALVGAGLVAREADGALTIRPWEETAFVDWTRSGGDSQVADESEPEEDARERRRRLDRERKAAAYAAGEPLAWRRHALVVHERDGWLCRYCGDAPEVPTLDHVDPKSRGGSHDPANLVTACGSCNSRKGARTPEEAGMALLPIPQPRAQA